MLVPGEYPESEEGDFVPGVYNYCDRWCDRCPMTDRCRLFADEALIDAIGPEAALGGSDPEEDEDEPEFGDRLFGGDDSGEAWKQGGAAEPEGYVFEWDDEVDDEELEAAHEEWERKEERRKQLPCAVLSFRYLEKSSEWIEAHAEDLRAKGVDLEELSPRRKLGFVPTTEPERLLDALDVIRWFQHLIHVKLRRALSSQEEEREDGLGDDPEFPSDADGSAKVALLGIDQSLAAWGALADLLPERADQIFEIRLLLDAIRRHAEAQFPQARAFQRPGFDD